MINYSLAIIGSRDFDDYDLLKEEIGKLPKPSLIVSGKAKGADSLGEVYAAEFGIPTKIFPALWRPNGEGGDFDKGAGMKRNVSIVENADAIIAFWDGVSSGTLNSINLSIMKKKFLKIVYYKIPELKMDESNILGFSGKYRWLSNMFPENIVGFWGITFPSVENAYQAGKFLNSPNIVRKMANIPPIESKILAKTLEINTPEFHSRKVNLMKYLLEKKFRNEVLKKKLAHTCGHIEETNTWGDTFWGCCPQGHGDNNLGEILMEIRRPLIDGYVKRKLLSEKQEEFENCHE